MDFIKQLFKQPINIRPLYLIYIFQLIILFGVVFGFLPRETLLSAAFLIALFLLFMKFEDAVLFFLASIPFFVALPLTRGFDNFNFWRLAILILFLRLVLKNFPARKCFDFEFIRTLPKRICQRLKNNRIELWTMVYFGISAVSILVAEDKITAIKRLIYVGQMILIYPLTLNIIKNKTLFKRAAKFLLFSASLVLLIGLGQLTFSYFADLGNFWDWWANHFSLNFYGTPLAKIVSGANTWFSYYVGRAPTLRMFSTFTDSHSFALYLLLASPLVLWLLIRNYFLKKRATLMTIFYGIMFLLLQFAMALSGTRGIWISVGAPITVAIFLLIKKQQKLLAKISLAGLLLFVLMLPLSSLFLSIPQFNVVAKETDKALTLKRLKSVIDIEEASNKGRIYIWKESLRALVKHPFLGVGIGNFPVVLGEPAEMQEAGATAHNVYLNSGVESGILALMAIVMIFYEILKECYRYFKKKIEDTSSILPMLLGFYFLWVFVYSLFDIAIFDARVMMMFSAEVALLIAIPSLQQA